MRSRLGSCPSSASRLRASSAVCGAAIARGAGAQRPARRLQRRQPRAAVSRAPARVPSQASGGRAGAGELRQRGGRAEAHRARQDPGRPRRGRLRRDPDAADAPRMQPGTSRSRATRWCWPTPPGSRGAKESTARTGGGCCSGRACAPAAPTRRSIPTGTACSWCLSSPSGITASRPRRPAACGDARSLHAPEGGRSHRAARGRRARLRLDLPVHRRDQPACPT